MRRWERPSANSMWNATFPAETKAKAQAMVDDLVKAFGKRIDALTWMSPETKAKAKQKLGTLKVGVGYPDRWQDYSRLEIVKGDALGNEQRAELFEYHRQLVEAPPAGRPRRVVDDSADGERGQSPLAERAEFPRRDPPAAVFRSRMPTQRTTTARWARSSGMRSATASTTKAASSMPRGGSPTGGPRKISTTSKPPVKRSPRSSTLTAFSGSGGERASDAQRKHRRCGRSPGGVRRLSALAGRESRTSVKDGFSGDQRFFISFGQSWRSKIRDAELRREIATDGHAPEQYRADAVRESGCLVRCFLRASAAEAVLRAEPTCTRLVGLRKRDVLGCPITSMSESAAIINPFFHLTVARDH